MKQDYGRRVIVTLKNMVFAFTGKNVWCGISWREIQLYRMVPHPIGWDNTQFAGRH